jgi:hypothetical protein
MSENHPSCRTSLSSDQIGAHNIEFSCRPAPAQSLLSNGTQLAVPNKVQAVNCNDLLDFAGMFHCYNYVSLLMAAFCIPVSFNHLFQRITSVNDRLYLPCFNKFV